MRLIEARGPPAGDVGDGGGLDLSGATRDILLAGAWARSEAHAGVSADVAADASLLLGSLRRVRCDAPAGDAREARVEARVEAREAAAVSNSKNLEAMRANPPPKPKRVPKPKVEKPKRGRGRPPKRRRKPKEPPPPPPPELDAIDKLLIGASIEGAWDADPNWYRLAHHEAPAPPRTVSRPTARPAAAARVAAVAAAPAAPRFSAPVPAPRGRGRPPKKRRRPVVEPVAYSGRAPLGSTVEIQWAQDPRWYRCVVGAAANGGLCVTSESFHGSFDFDDKTDDWRAAAA
ncbi:hypothetical protein M885DRAFT_82219 [Pelagophyceae sp. CCMP2097]|nr:hypothetical protein M885DRAFT_82219 [Pelagophyceae sp. CCMP2097]